MFVNAKKGTCGPTLIIIILLVLCSNDNNYIVLSTNLLNDINCSYFAFSGTVRETTINQHRHTSLVTSVDAVTVFDVVREN